MPLVGLQDGPSQWADIKDAAYILWRASIIPDINGLGTELQIHYHNPHLLANELRTGVNAGRKAVVVYSGERITIAFQGSDPSELIINTWTNAKGPRWWDIPYPVYENGNRIHSFFRLMWHGMRQKTYDALRIAVEDMTVRGVTPKQIIITGFSMGGGVST